MTLPGPIDHAPLLPLLPESRVGTTTRAVPIHMGLSGAAVYAITTTRGEYILRVAPGHALGRRWERQLEVQRRAATHGIAPPIVHVDEGAHAVLSVRIAGGALPAALADPAQRGAAIGGTVAALRALHALDPAGVDPFDVVAFTRELYASQRARDGFPTWASEGDALLDAVAAALARDPRAVPSHNDMNPGNVLWDGERAWLVDWEAAGLTHPFYDLAALTTFLALDQEGALGLLALQEGQPVTEAHAATFALLRRLVALAAGCMFLRMSPAARVPATTREETPTLMACYARMREGTLEMRHPEGQAAIALALLRAFAGP
ncbi:MAG TPA: phosphotransferase [Gemmatimonadaceae bacterium]